MKEIPDTSKWLPSSAAIESLKDIFYKRCLISEEMIVSRYKYEKEFNINNFDSGPGVEDIVRDELSKILPKRYLVTKGVLNDRNGFTSGDQDLIIFNDFWFPYLKAGATKESRRLHFPIEGVYAVGEIKQTLTSENLDEALKKLVIAKRLERPKTGRTRITENRELDSCGHGYTNPLFSFVVAVNLDDSITIDDVFLRFFEINKQLKRSELINSLCILQKGTICWSNINDESNEMSPARFNHLGKGMNEPILPILLAIDDVRKSAFFDLITLLLANTYDSILGAEDISFAYSNGYAGIKIPPKEKFLINPK